MTNSIDHIMKSRNQMEPNFISPESVKNIICVSQETKKFEQEESPQKTYSKPLKKQTKVYPFTVYLPRYASWRAYVRPLLNQLKSCPICRAAADAFPISNLPTVHKLPNGKVLIFKGLTSAGFSPFNGAAQDCCSFSPQVSSYIEPTSALSTIHDGVEEYDMVSIDPHCPRHGKYSLTAWLRQDGTKVKVGKKPHQIVSKAKENKADKSISLDIWKPLDNFHLSTLDNDTVEKPSRVATLSTLKKRKGEILESNVSKQIETNMTLVLSQRQPNTLSTHSQQKDLVPKQSHKTKAANLKLQMEKFIKKEQSCIYEESTDDDQNTSMKIKVKCETPSSLVFRIPIVNKSYDKDVHKCPKTYASQYRRMCHLKGLNRNYLDICDDAILCTKNQERRQQYESVSEMERKDDNFVAINLEEDFKPSMCTTPTEFTKNEQVVTKDIFEMELAQTSQRMECIQHENDNFIEETKTKVEGDEASTCTIRLGTPEVETSAFIGDHNWYLTVSGASTLEEPQMASDIFDMKELQKISQWSECVQYENNNLINETRFNVEGNKSSSCTPNEIISKEQHMANDIFDMQELEQTSQWLECVQYENDNLINETKINVRDESSSCTPNEISNKEQQMANDMFDMKELEQTRQQLEQIAHRAKALQLGLTPKRTNPLYTSRC